MTRASLFSSLCLMVLALGCASQSELDEVRTLLEECKADKVAAQEASSACEERYESEVRQWQSMETVVEEVLPTSLKEFRSERDKIVELVPEQTREEVQKYLDDFAEAVSQGFQVLQESNELVLVELDRSKAKLDRLGVRTTSIDNTVGKTLQDAFASRDRVIQNRDRMIEKAAAIVEEIHEFDRDYVSEKASPERLRLNRKERETIQLFHDDLVTKLAALAQSTAAPE